LHNFISCLFYERITNDDKRNIKLMLFSLEIHFYESVISTFKAFLSIFHINLNNFALGYTDLFTPDKKTFTMLAD